LLAAFRWLFAGITAAPGSGATPAETRATDQAIEDLRSSMRAGQSSVYLILH
jgi:hypothetical protein